MGHKINYLIDLGENARNGFYFIDIFIVGMLQMKTNAQFPKPKKRETSFLNNKEEKKRIRESFESRIDINEEYDNYIDKQYKKMVQEKSENPTLNIPTGFQKFVESKSFKQLLKKIY